MCLVLIIFRHCVKIQRVILALAGADDVVTHSGHEFDNLHAGRWLVSCAKTVNDTKPISLTAKIGSDGDVSLDIHHYQMLAVFHRAEPNFGADSRHTSGVDHDIYETGLDQHVGRGYGGTPTFYYGVDVIARRSVSAMALGTMRDGDCLMGPCMVDVGDCGNLNSLHHRRARHNVGAHLT